MASVREIKRHIKSVSNIKKITKTMQMVAGAKMQKTLSALLASRPYAQLAWNLLLNLAPKTERELHPLLQIRGIRNSLLVVITSDRGLCGAFNMNVIGEALRQIKDKETHFLITVGKKGRDFFIRRGYKVIAEFTGLGAPAPFISITPISQIIIDEFIKGNVDEVKLVYSDYVSNVIQRPTTIQLLPFQQEQPEEPFLAQFIYEPSPSEVIENLLVRIIEYKIYAAILESQASEFSARMMAMKNATENAENLIQSLILSYNKARQEGITKELTELSTTKAVIESLKK
ncbi:MAG: ATP synthase F1 subunit gamma [candidate division WOR-3 bacterium]|nr:ATP synthase F1 subunit gamma [candidate division WOR-3 bacterium]